MKVVGKFCPNLETLKLNSRCIYLWPYIESDDTHVKSLGNLILGVPSFNELVYPCVM